MKYPHLQYSGIKNKPYNITKDFKIKLSNGDTAIIPKGYWTDCASIPFPLNIMFPRFGKHQVAFILHDYLYNFRGYKLTGKDFMSGNRADIFVDRAFADKEMKYQMAQSGAWKIKQWLYYIAVRFGGIFSYGTI